MKKNILLGVTGSIAVYKAAEVAHRFVKQGLHVDVVMTAGATKFVTPLTFRTLTQNRVYTDMFEENFPAEVEHISLAKKADVILIAPATANVIGKISGGIADDMLTTVVMAVKNKPILIAPAMNTNMWENPIVQENCAKLKKLGYRFIEPRSSLLACGDVGKGALAEEDKIVEAVLESIEKS